MPRPRKPDPKKYCEHCGSMLERKMFKNTLEGYTEFLKRKFCSLSCANSKKSMLTKHGYSWRARKHISLKCEACGQGRALHAHHVDQDITNNIPENIQTLCKPCHMFWHVTAKRLGLDIAGRMPKIIHGKADGMKE